VFDQIKIRFNIRVRIRVGHNERTPKQVNEHALAFPMTAGAMPCWRLAGHAQAHLHLLLQAFDRLSCAQRRRRSLHRNLLYPEPQALVDLRVAAACDKSMQESAIVRMSSRSAIKPIAMHTNASRPCNVRAWSASMVPCGGAHLAERTGPEQPFGPVCSQADLDIGGPNLP